jgi:hypothetical protein
MRFLQVTAMLLGALKAWEYGNNHGLNWHKPPLNRRDCENKKGSPQSPIDLPFKLPGLGDVKFATEDGYNKIF